jgi:hypothetical protein
VHDAIEVAGVVEILAGIDMPFADHRSPIGASA